MSTRPDQLLVSDPSTTCVRCGRRLLHFRVADAQADTAGHRGCVRFEQDEIVSWVAFDQNPQTRISLDVEWLTDSIRDRAVWTIHGDVERLTEPALRLAASKLGRSTRLLSLGIAHALVQIIERVRGTSCDLSLPCCHGFVINDHLGTVLTIEVPHDAAKVGLLHIASLFEQPKASRAAAAGLPIPLELLEAQPDEPTLSIQELNDLECWVPGRCDRMPTRRRWLHLVLVSHRWGHPVHPTTPLAEVKQAVLAYVDRELSKAKEVPNSRMKARCYEDFGIWIDYMLVPNDIEHEAQENCEACKQIKTRLVIRINALLTVASVVAISKDAGGRGWILQEMSLDKHGVTPYEHRDRISLMIQDVDFSKVSGSGLAIDDSLLLRCGEFVRLALTPRVWPAVNDEFLDALKDQHSDERTIEAWPMLMEYARSFTKRCHDMKRLMAQVVQALAIAGSSTGAGLEVSGRGTFQQPLDLSGFSNAVEAQRIAMQRLASRIERGSEHLSVDGQQIEIAVTERSELTVQLHWQQLVAAGMGLRAELCFDAGLGSWVQTSAIAEGLGGTKFMARLKDGCIEFDGATSVTLQDEPRGRREQLLYARYLVTNGVPLSDFERVQQVGRDFRSKHRTPPPEIGRL